MDKNQIIFGRQPILEALRSDIDLEKVVIDREVKGEFEIKLRQICRDKGIPISRVPGKVLGKYTRGNHQGVIAMTSFVNYKTEEELIQGVSDGDINFVLVLDHITDVRNVGAILRSAHFFGVKHVLLPMKKTAEMNKDAMKSSAGALVHVNLYRSTNIISTVLQLKDQECSIYALESKGGKSLQSVNINRPGVLIIGSEGYGVTREMLKMTDERILIEAMSDFDSLNVSVATGIALYELTKQ